MLLPVGKYAPWLVVGLGNFGPEYDNTRHNSGFAALDELVKLISDNSLGSNCSITDERRKFKGYYRTAQIGRTKIILLKPYTYMNASGESVYEAMKWFDIDNSHLVVIYDDCDLPLGKLRVRSKGSAGTHNGMKSVLQYVDDDVFPRVRIGIGNNTHGGDLVSHVLGHYTKEEQEIVKDVYVKAAKAAACICTDSCEKAMASFNG